MLTMCIENETDTIKHIMIILNIEKIGVEDYELNLRFYIY